MSSYSDSASAQLKLYQVFIFSIPIFFTLILLFLFYLFYLRRRRVDWSSLRTRASLENNPRLSESGLKKELREMLPIIVFNQTFSINDTLCSVCLGEYRDEDKLQQIPACCHTFHMDCIDNWLAKHATCPLCRFSLVPSSKSDVEPSNDQLEAHADEAQTNMRLSEDNNQRFTEDRGRYSGNEISCNPQNAPSGQGSVIMPDLEVRDTVEPAITGVPHQLV